MVTGQPISFHLQFSFLFMYLKADQLPHLTSVLTALKRLAYSKTVKNTYYNPSTTEKNFIYLQTSSSWKAQLFLQQKNSYSVLTIKYFNWRWSFWDKYCNPLIPSVAEKQKWYIGTVKDVIDFYMYHLPFFLEILTLAFGKVHTFLQQQY